ncbi:autotransporter-associated beta strand repeat-containing protein [Jinshanibacter sp. LJY008]|uniref:Autotransporter-associated beta strand repeat-containing protein n=1 Tax=Limnobaculum eriocheiris TaxID=2897391 RepID=A0A9X1SNY4_9GAMM|nr:autotransporter-associated beta strand repeat-containing protein [Limnobaculum eriocheiris]MCD1125452.1 autotransporter-associated beta strand repeat-containing protein [Limnobaculum eriocheiris]
MNKKHDIRNSDKRRFNSLHKAIVLAFPAFYLSLSIPLHAATTLTEGQDIYTNGLNTGSYDLLLDGNVTWNTMFAMNNLSKTVITINGNDYTITINGSSSQRLLDITQTSNTISINNVTITSKPFTGARSSLIRLYQLNDKADINLEGTTFLDIGPTDYNTYASADYGPILSIRGSTGTVMNVDGGTTGVLFKGNHGLADQPGVVGLYSNNTMNFTGKVTFDSNWTGNYGGALTVFDVAGSKMSFAGETNFINNHSSVFGGAIDFWGASAAMDFNGPATFTGNYVYGTTTNSFDYPDHVDDQHTRGGAINIGYLSPGASGLNLNFNNTATFSGNYVIEPKNNYNALGGAVSAYGNGGNYNYFMNFNGATTFDGNYVYSLTGSGYGGAIYYDAGSAATLNLGPGSSVTNNYAKTQGGGIYLKTGTINLKANGGDILFQGNRQGASFALIGSGPLYAPEVGSGNPNAIYLGGTGSLNLDVSDGNFIHFYDPIASVSTATITVNKTGAGEVLFHGNSSNPGDPLYNSDIQTNTNVNGGAFSLTDGVNYGNSGFGIFAVNNGGMVQGNNNSILEAKTININSGGTVAANGGIFNLNAGTGGVISTAGRFSGFGTIVAPGISLSTSAANVSTADIATDNTLTLDSLLTNAGSFSKSGAGTLILTKTNTYTGATSISDGTLQANNTNIIAASSGLNMTGGVFDLNNLNQTLKSLSGTAGAITTGTGVLTVNGTSTTSYAGTISGNGNLLKQGTGGLTLTGNVTLNAPGSELQVTGGSLNISGGSQTQITTGTVDSNAALNLSDSGTNVQFNDLYVGNSASSNSTFFINSGAQAHINNILYIGSLDNSQGNVLVNGAGTLLDANLVLVGNSAGSGTLNLNNSGVLLTNSLQKGTGRAGVVNFNAGILQAKSDNANFISEFAAGDLVLGATGGTIDSNGFNIATGNIFSGTGRLTKSGSGIFTLTGVNTYTGGTSVSGGTLRLTGAGTVSSGGVNIASGASMFVDTPSSGNYSFNNALTGSGLLQVGLLSGTNTFQFGGGVGSAFAGTVQLGNSSFALSGNNTTALTSAILQLDSGSTTTVGAGTQNIGGLTLNGGSLIFNNLPTGVINTGALTLTSGSIAIDPNTITNVSGNILGQDDGVDFRLITAGSVSGSAANLTLTDLLGNQVVESANVVQGGNTVAIGSYDFALGNDATGLYTRYSLSQLDLQNGQTLTLSGDATTPTGMDELHAKITGTGNLLINATNSITLNNLSNDYSGTTTVGTGSLILGSNNALGNTSDFIINSGATADLNGKTQTVGLLHGDGGLNMNSGGLTITGGGDFDGVISGNAGEFTLQGGDLLLLGNNTYTGTTNINSGSNLQIGNGGTIGDYAGNITNNGQVTFNRSNDSSYTGIISGSGYLSKFGTGTLTLSGANTYQGGSQINFGTLVATQGNVLGTGIVNNNSTLELNFANNSVFSNVLNGVGYLVKTGAGIATLDSLGSTQGSISVNQGTLAFVQNGIFNASNLTTANGATLDVAGPSTLNLSGALTQNSGSILNVGVGTGQTAINADTASLGGTLNITDFNANVPDNASALIGTEFTVIHTTNGITNDFSTVDLGGAQSDVDYLTLSGRVVNGVDYNIGLQLTWLAGALLGNGTFTLGNASDLFNVDVVLADQTGPFTSGWDGKTLTKEGDGTLQLSSVNTYTGGTFVNGGILQTGIANAFAGSSNVSVGSGATLDLNSFNQQANNLSGEGSITLGSAVLTANNSADSAFNGVINGTGSLTKTGTGTLTLGGTNTYQGGTSVNAGTLTITQGGALGTGSVNNSASLELNFASTSQLNNVLSGSGNLVKTGAGIAVLNRLGSTQGDIAVNQGTLSFVQNGIFNASSLTTADGATLDVAGPSTLNLSGALTQNINAILNVGVGTGQTAINADTASLGGALNIIDFNPDVPDNASALIGTEFTVIHTTNGITNDFSSVDLGGAQSDLNYLTLSGRVVNGVDYNVGFYLTWQAGALLGNGIFTVGNPSNLFNVDMVLADQAGPFISGWDGKTLTKDGLGILQLSSVNTYTGSTLINGGTLETGIANAFATSSNVVVANGGTLNLNGFNQLANNLSGAGSITLRNAVLTANNSADTAFDGEIGGAGSLIKTGTGALTLSGINTYQGGSTLNGGTLVATNGLALGVGDITNNATLELNFASDSTLDNLLSGSGTLIKTGSGIATLTSTGSSQGAINVNQGTLSFAQSGAFNGISLTTGSGATTSVAANSSLDLSGALTQDSGSTLNINIGTAELSITADTASLAGALSVSGFTANAPASASVLPNTEFTIIHTDNGISGDFSSIDFNGSGSLVDYLTLGGRVVNGVDYHVGMGLTWLAGSASGNGLFTLANADDMFNVDVALADQTGTFTSGWDGKTLTKAGLGTLILSSANSYTGDTLINAGTLETGIANAFASSSNVVVNSSTLLNLNNFDQLANNLSGAGNIKLGSATLTANNNAGTTFSGEIGGDGSLIKTGTGTLTLSGENTYLGDTTISDGILVATNGNALGSGTVNNSAALELNFTTDSTLNNILSGSGSLTKTGTGIATLSGVGSTQGAINVSQGALNLAQNVVLNGTSLITANDATLSLAQDASLNLSGTLTQSSTATLNIDTGTSQPAITAGSASLGGSLNVTSFTTSAPASASALPGTEYTLIHTVNGITGDFASVDLGGAASNVDYLTLAGRIVNGVDYNLGFGLTWQAGDALGNGIFTLTDASDLFNVDVVLVDQTGTFTSGWDGKTLTKEGLGILQLSSVNTYTGSTLVNGGTLQAGIANAFASSSNVVVTNGGTLNLNGFDQLANNLSGAGSITLRNAVLTANNGADTSFDGEIGGDGSLVKTGTGALTLSGINTYQGGSTLSDGTLIATNGLALGVGNIENNATLELNFASDSSLNNLLSGSGTLTKTGMGVASLGGVGSTQGAVNVNQGTLSFTQDGIFTASSLTTADGATTSLAGESILNLSGALTQNSTSVLNVGVGTGQTAINADTASLGGTLNITDFNANVPDSASALTNTEFTVIHTANGITNNFTTVDLGGAQSDVDYLTLSGRVVNGVDYNIGFQLTWLTGNALGNGTFTLGDASSLFNVDVVLADQPGPFTSGWDGKSLTKEGLGTLQLSSVNTYTGSTLVNAGTLETGIANAFASSSNVVVANGGTLNLNGFDQLANNLSGAGSITLRNAILTANNSTDTAFDGEIGGAGSLMKTGTGTLTLSGINTYQGGSTLSAGTLVATNGLALGVGDIENNVTLELNFASDSEMANLLSGSGSLVKTGAGVASLSSTGSNQGAISVNQGTLNFTQNGGFGATSLTTADGASTSLEGEAVLNLSGALTQNSSSILNVEVGSGLTAINADSASLGGTLNITGFNTAIPNSASALTNTEFTVIHTLNGITNDFALVDLGGAESDVDYLTLAGQIVNGVDYNVGFGLTWQAGNSQGNGTFTLTNASDLFNVDMVLADQTGPFTSGWDGKSLTKAGLGTLQLSAVNTYTGSTLINTGTLQTGIANAFATSSDVTVASGATLDLNNFDQQANNLNGAGSILLGSATLTANNSADTAFSGVIEGTGNLSKTGTGTLTLSGESIYEGGSNISAGTLVATQGNALGTGNINNTATLELNFLTDSTLSNLLSGSGTLIKSGAGMATLNAVGAAQGNVAVNSGTLNFVQTGAFTADNLTTATGATTMLAANATLNLSGALTQNTNAILDVTLGIDYPIISAVTAALDGSLKVSGIDTSIIPVNASDLDANNATIIHTTGGISGDFTTVDLGGAASSVDYLTLAGRIVGGVDYNVGLGLTWLAGSSLGNGTFTLTNVDDLFNVDVILADQTGSFTSAWDGKSLTKAGLGTLQLSAVNTYTGSTLVNAGTLQTGIANAFATSSDVAVASGATLDLNNFAQQANNLSGTGSILLGSAALIASNSADTTFSGVIDGTGSLMKIGTGTLTLSGDNTYQGGSTISDGTLVATNAGALGTGAINNTATLELNFASGSTLRSLLSASDNTLSNVLSGNGTLTKTGAGTATLTGVGSTQGAINVNQGTLNFAQSGVFNGSSLTTANDAITSLAADSTLNLSGALTQNTTSVLNVAVGSANPAIVADSAALDGTLNITGFSTTAPTSASDLTNTEFTVIHTTGSGGITGDFTAVDLGGAASSVDYLTLAGRVVNNTDYNVGFGLTWLAGTALGNGTFTLTNAGDLFNVDVVLADQTGSFTSNWDGKSLTKAGAGTLQLSAVNTYTGSTLVNAGTLQTGIANAFATSSDVTVASGATLDLNSFAQQANNLSGAGSILLGSAVLTANNNADTSFSGVMSGSGSLTKTGTGTLTLSGVNTYQGGSTLSGGTLIATQGSALGTGSIDNGATLELNFASDSTLSNLLTGSGNLNKTGAGVATLTGAGSTQGAINVNQGTLNFAQSGVFNGSSLTTANDAITSVAADASLSLTGALTQNATSVLNVAVGSVQPAIAADTAALDGTLNITGFTASAPTNASALINTEFNVIHTTSGITGDFTAVDLGGAASSVDYLTLAGRVVNNTDYNVGFGLTWLAGTALGNGTFTLTNAGDLFNVDVVLADQTGPFTSSWDGKSLTKAGAGTLQLSAVNTYTGSTLVNAGTLQTGIANAFATSSDVTVASGATLDLNSFAQQANNLSGAGSILLGSAVLTANNNADTSFSGVMSGSGSLTKTGTGTLTLSGVNTYQGGSTLSGGTLIATQGSALGTGSIDNGATLELNFASDSTLSNLLTGSGNLNKTGAGVATLTGAGSTQGVINVNQGTLNFAQVGDFNGSSLTTSDGATTALAEDSTLNLSGSLVQNSGSTLSVLLGTTQPVIQADTSTLSGTLKVIGIDGDTNPTKASDLPNTEFTIIHTTNGITGDFTNIDLNGVSSAVDYLTVSAGKSVDNKDYNVGYGLTWLAGTTLANGTFTLTNANDKFNVDIVLADQAGSSTGWNGQSLTKEGSGTLILSSANTYTGDTLINNGTLQTGIANAFADSGNVIIHNNGILSLNSFEQSANNLSGNGGVLLGNSDLTVNSLAATTFAGSISGNGGLIKTGTETFTLTGVNFYSGSTTINQGRLVGTRGLSLGLSDINNNAELELAFAQDSTLINQLTGSGELIKTGAGIATLIHGGSSQGSVSVDGGTLKLAQTGAFNADDYHTSDGATTSMAANAALVVANQFKSDGTLAVVAGNTSPVVTADTAALGSNAVFNLSGYSAPETTSASQLAYNQFMVINTSAPGNLTGNFASFNLGGATSPVDYLSMTAIHDGQNYSIGLALAWYGAYSVTPDSAHGTFTLNGANEYFDLDVVLADEVANATTGWDGKTLTKAGEGTLQLSKANSYSGATLINGGTLLAGNANVIANSSQLAIAAGATFNLNNFDQRINNLSGGGNVVLGDAVLTTNHSTDTTFSGVISGAGSLNKTGNGVLLLTGDNIYAGGTTITSGTLQLGNGGTSGSVIGNIADNGTLVFDRSNGHLYNDVISGTGNVVQQGSGTLFMNNNQTYQGTTDVNAGALVLLKESLLTSVNTVSVAAGAELGGYGGVNGSVINNGLLAVADAAVGFVNAPAGNFTIGGNITNAGEIRMSSPDPRSQLIVKGNYIGNNGLLTISTILGDDNSATDKLVVAGDTSGTTRLVVNNSGGAGAQTVNGIEVVSVAGQSNGQFTLANRVVAGAYEYSLYQGLPSAVNGNWYLRSQGPGETPQWRPEAGIYLGNQSIASQLQMQTLFDRQGSQFRSADNSSWGRIIGGRVDSKAAGHNIDMSSDYTLIQIGSDLLNYNLGDSGLVAGVMGSWGDVDTDSTGNADLNGTHHSATGTVEGFNLGVYATWFADAKEQTGAYIDNWYQYGWYDNHVSGEGMTTDSYDSRPFAASLETGYSFILNSNPLNQWRLIPQAQVVYNKYSADSFVDSSNTKIDGQNNDVWNTRLGTRVTGNIQGKGYTHHPFAEVNWWYSKQDASVTFDGMRIDQDMPNNRAELKVGIQSEFDNKWSTWVNLGVQSGADDYHNIGGGIGVRYVW